MNATHSAAEAATPSPARVGFAAGVGTVLEFYDFAIYSTAAALVFNDVFFVTKDPWLGSFLSFATFAIGFVAAPLGAAFFGWLGDRHGRRTALLGAFFLMGAATLAIGLIPPASSIGVTAAVLVVVLRVFHGAARGGENVGAAVFATEHAPANRRGLYGAFVAIGSPIGNILANVAFSLVLLLPPAAVTSWGWRIPFFLGGIVLLLGLWVRTGVAETPAFQSLVHGEDERAGVPLLAALRDNWRRILAALGINLGLTATTFTLATFMLSYATLPQPLGLGLPRQPIVMGSLLALLAHAVSNVLSAMVSDRVGRRPVLLTGAILTAATTLVIFPLSARGDVASVVGAMVLGFAASGVLFGPLYTFITELFPREQRQSGAGVAYHVGAVLGGGITPMIANRIVATTGDATNVGYYLAALLVLSGICILALPETAPARLRGRAAPSAEVEVPAPSR